MQLSSPRRLGLRGSWRYDQHVGLKLQSTTTHLHCVTTQNCEDPIYTATEALNHDNC